MINGKLDKVTNYWQTTLPSIYKVTATINNIRLKKKKKQLNKEDKWTLNVVKKSARKVRWVENKVGR